MAAYLIRRIWQMVPTLFGVVLLVFLLFKGFGGDPAEILAGLNATQAQVDAIRQQLGLNEPLWTQFGIFLKQIVTFDWGRSWATNESVANLFATRLPATLTVMVPILVLDTLLAIPFALGVAYVRGSLTDRTIMVATTVALSISFLVYVIDRPVRVRVPARPVPGAGLERQPGDQPAPVRAAAGDARRRRLAGADDAALPHLLPRRDRPRLRAHGARQGPDRERRSCSSTCCATR